MYQANENQSEIYDLIGTLMERVSNLETTVQRYEDELHTNDWNPSRYSNSGTANCNYRDEDN